MKYIDLETYPRKSHFEFFRAMAYPYVGLTANVDVTALLDFARDRGGSTFLACLWAAANAANSVPELRQRIFDDKIGEYGHCDTSHTVALADGTFRNCRTDCRMDLEAFLTYGKARQAEAGKETGFVSPEEDERELMFVSCIPWVAFTQAIQPVPIPGDCIPRLLFGKFQGEGERTTMPLHIQCNHALVDGRHIGQFYKAFADITAAVARGDTRPGVRTEEDHGRI